jgi:general secretion pathway protein G
MLVIMNETNFTPKGETIMKQRKGEKKDRRRERGFTLIEIMVVVMIIGMLTTIVGIRVMDSFEKARRKAAALQIKQLETALNTYYMDNGFFPTTEQGLEALVNAPTTTPQPKNYNPNGYLDNIPTDPWKNPYHYSFDGKKIYLESYGADGNDGGEGNAADIESWDLGEDNQQQ